MIELIWVVLGFAIVIWGIAAFIKSVDALAVLGIAIFILAMAALMCVLMSSNPTAFRTP